MKKTDFCPKVDSDYLRGTCKNVVYHFHGTIQTIITSYIITSYVRPVKIITFEWKVGEKENNLSKKCIDMTMW